MQRNNGNIFGGIGLINAESVKAKLKKHAKENGTTMQDVLVMYGLERTLYRLSKSSFADQFTLKGGILLYALFEGDFARATTDIDLHAQEVGNDIEKMKILFTNVFQIKADDALVFDLNTLEVIAITEFKEYHGVNVTIMSYLDKTKIKVTMDIGFGDVIYPERVRIEFPALLDMEEPKFYAYSIYTVVAEKFEAFVQLGYANSRYKDFYDIYILATTHNFDGKILQQAILETFEHRRTKLDDIVAFELDFITDKVRKIRWSAFIKKKKAMVNVGFEEAIELIKIFLEPIASSLANQEELSGEWNFITQKWE